MSALEPHYVSVKEAAKFLAVSEWSVRQKLDKQEIESRYDGSRRLVVVASLREYAESLSEYPTKAGA